MGPPLIVVWILLVTGQVGGCEVGSKAWIEQMISEMESAWVEANRAGLGHEGREAAVSLVAREYFWPGMGKEEALKLLRELKDYGFVVGEYRHEGAREWPDGKFKSYSDEATRQNLQNRYQTGQSEFIATKIYDRDRIIVDKVVTLSFRVNDGVNAIADVEARLSASAI